MDTNRPYIRPQLARPVVLVYWESRVWNQMAFDAKTKIPKGWEWPSYAGFFRWWCASCMLNMNLRGYMGLQRKVTIGFVGYFHRTGEGYGVRYPLLITVAQFGLYNPSLR